VVVQRLNVTKVYETALFDYHIVSSSVYENSYNLTLHKGVQQKVSTYCTVVFR